MWTLLFALALLILSGGAVEFETRLQKDWAGLFVGRILGRSVEVQFVRYRPRKTLVMARAW